MEEQAKIINQEIQMVMVEINRVNRQIDLVSYLNQYKEELNKTLLLKRAELSELEKGKD
jgi:hypothetical protein